MVSILVGIAAGATGYYKFRERSFNLQKTADEIELECNALELRIRRYKGLKFEVALPLFAEQVESMKEEQQKRQQQLEQPPEGKQEQN